MIPSLVYLRVLILLHHVAFTMEFLTATELLMCFFSAALTPAGTLAGPLLDPDLASMHAHDR